VKARAGSWHVLQAVVPSTDKRPSKKSFWPSAIFSGVCGLSTGTAARVASTGTPTCLRDLGSASGPAAGIGDGLAGVCGDASTVASKFQLAASAISPPRVSAAALARNIVQNRIRFPTGLPATLLLVMLLFPCSTSIDTRCQYNASRHPLVAVSDRGDRVFSTGDERSTFGCEESGHFFSRDLLRDRQDWRRRFVRFTEDSPQARHMNLANHAGLLLGRGLNYSKKWCPSA
jgi:hypothetical protein